MSSSAITGPVLSDVRRAPSGTAAAPSFAFNDSTGTGVYLVSAGVLGLSTAGVQRVVVDASGNVGIGVTPSAWGSYYPAIEGSAASAFSIAAKANDFQIGANYYQNNAFQNLYTTTGQRAAKYVISAPDSTHKWFTTGALGTAGNAITFTQAMTLDASGNLLVGRTNQYVGEKFSVLASGASANTASFAFGSSDDRANVVFYHNRATGSTSAKQASFLNTSGVEVGSITSNGSATAYNINSDHRLKEDVKPMSGALNRVAALKPVTYKWKSDGSEGEGFIAHELQAICPLAVVGEKDAVNEDGSIKSQGMDPSKLVSLLTAAIQELSAKNDALEARLAALESK